MIFLNIKILNQPCKIVDFAAQKSKIFGGFEKVDHSIIGA